MPKRSSKPVKPKYTAGPLDENTGQRSVFPELLTLKRDKEWSYDEDVENDADEDYKDDDELVGQAFNVNSLDFGDEVEKDEDAEESKEEGMSEAEMEDEWEMEPQTEVLAYLHSVRSEAETLPSLTYVEQAPTLVNGGDASSKKDLTNGVELDEDAWRKQFLNYYHNLRITIANTPEPDFTQDELDELLHINPNRRPETSGQEDGLWRLKTLDPPSLTLLSMLDHQRTIHLLTHLRKKMSVNVKKEQCMWLLFLLARLGDPGVLGGDEIDLLRRVGKKCINVRDSLEGEGNELLFSTVDMVVCIIKHFYGQMDLEGVV